MPNLYIFYHIIGDSFNITFTLTYFFECLSSKLMNIRTIFVQKKSFGLLIQQKYSLSECRLSCMHPELTQEKGYQVLNKYKVVKTLKKSEFGSVILVNDQFGKQLTIKKIQKSHLMQDISLEVIREDIKKRKKVKSPYMEEIHNFEEDSNCLYAVCESYTDADLLCYRAKQKQQVFELDEALQLISHVIRGLEAIHRHHYLYQSFKLQNILIASDQSGMKTFKLMNFIFPNAKRIIDPDTCSLLQSDPFQSPEIRCNQSYGFQVDMWSLGVLLFFILNMEFPFKITIFDNFQMQTEVLRKMASNFNYEERVKDSKRKIMQNCSPEMKHLFKRIFDIDPKNRMTFSQIRQNSLLKKYFPERAGRSKAFYENKNVEYLSKPGQMQLSCFTQTPEELYLAEKHDKIVFLTQVQKDIEQDCSVLDKSAAASLSYNLIKYVIVLHRQFQSELTWEKLKKDASELDWKFFLTTSTMKKLRRQYKQELNKAEEKFSSLFNFCETYLEQINEINPYFKDSFKQKVTEKQFSQFKRSYRRSTNHVYIQLLKLINQDNKEDCWSFLAIQVTMCHCLSQILIHEEKLKDILAELQQKQTYEINMKDIRKYIMYQNSGMHRKIVSALTKAYFQQ